MNIAKSPELLRRTILNRVGRATPLHIEFANALITWRVLGHAEWPVPVPPRISEQ